MKRRRGAALKGVQILNKINTIKHQEKKRAKKGMVYNGKSKRNKVMLNQGKESK